MLGTSDVLHNSIFKQISNDRMYEVLLTAHLGNDNLQKLEGMAIMLLVLTGSLNRILTCSFNVAPLVA